MCACSSYARHTQWYSVFLSPLPCVRASVTFCPELMEPLSTCDLYNLSPGLGLNFMPFTYLLLYSHSSHIRRVAIYLDVHTLVNAFGITSAPEDTYRAVHFSAIHSRSSFQILAFCLFRSDQSHFLNLKIGVYWSSFHPTVLTLLHMLALLYKPRVAYTLYFSIQ